MKKITLLLLFLFVSINSYSQLSLEGFENTTGPDASPSTNWTLGTGNWAVFDNTVGPIVRWGINSTTATPPFVFEGANAAFVNRGENIGAGNTSEDYLATPAVLIPTNGVLHFYTRMLTTGNQGTIYQIKIAPATASQTDPFAYSLVQQWTEDELIVPTTNFNIYTEQTVNLSAFASQFVYVSFVKIYTQLTVSTDDCWLIDNVQIDSPCLTPTGLTVSAITASSASLNWTNPNGTGTASWEIEVVLASGTPTGVPTNTTTSFPFIVSGLLPNTAYKYYVRAICTTGFSSPWSAASANFTTLVAPPGCGGNYVDSGGIANNYGNNITAATGTTVVTPSTPGQVATVTFTSFNTQLNSDILKIYNGTVSPANLIGSFSGTTLPPVITSSAADGSLSFVFTSNGSVTAAGWVSYISCDLPIACPKPIALTTSSLTSNSVSLGWTATGTSTSWQVLALPCSSPAPTASTIGFVSTGLNPYVFTALTSATCYNLYVRSDCDSAGVSEWSLPVSINTPVSPPVCGGNYVDSGGLANNYANNTTAATGTTVVTPTTVGEVVTITFTSFNTELNNDVLKIYNGTVSPANLIGTFSGTTLPPVITSSAADGSLTLVFTSNGSVTAAGWLANITCGLPPVCSKPIALTTSGLTSNSVSLGWTATGTATSWQVLALPCSSPAPNASTTGFVSTSINPYVFTALTSITCYNLYVRSDCDGAGLSEWSSPVTINTPVSPPVCGGNYVDAGGLANNYANNTTAATGTTVITPTTVGEVVTITFTAFNTELNNDVLKIYNGSVSPANLIGTFSGTTLPPMITSSAADGSLTFVFTSNATVTASGWVSNITCGLPPNCPQPLALNSSNLTANSVSLGWTSSGSSTLWQVLALPCSAPSPTDSTTGWEIATTNPFVIPNLNATTCYNLYVRTDCSDSSGGTSIWSLPLTINTPCAFYNVPFQEGFNTGSTSEQCWTVVNSNNDADAWNLNYTITPYEGDQSATLTTDFNAGANNDWLISPQVLLNGNQRLKFRYKVQSANEPNDFRVMLSTNGTNPIDFTTTLIPLSSYSNATYLEKTVSLIGYSGLVNIAWHVPAGGLDGWRLYVDNVIIENLPSCPEPTSLSVSNTTQTSTTVSWVNGNTETSWQLLVLPCGSPTPTAATTGFIDALTNPFPLDNLSSATCYDVYVRALCSNSELSVWSEKISFNTKIDNDECTNAKLVQINGNGTCNLTTSGSVAGATASSQGNTCTGTDDDDVWFQFTATTTSVIISLNNVAGSSVDLVHVLYSGVCNNLTQLYCSDPNTSTANNLIVGETYYIRVYSFSAAIQTTTFNICIKSPLLPPSCSTLTPASDVCLSAPPICNLNGYCGNTSAQYNADAWPELEDAFCNASIENDSYITFQANATSVTLNVWVTSSLNGDGIQMLFFSIDNNNCGGTVTAYGCYNPLAPAGNVPYEITATGLTPGNTYYLVIDGYAGDVCDYVVSVPSNGGVTTQVVVTSPNPNICLSGQTTLTATGGNGLFNWTVSPPSTGLSSTTGNSVTFTPSATGNYSITATSTDGNLSCPQALSDTEIIVVSDVSVPTYEITQQPTCVSPTGTIEVKSPLSVLNGSIPSNLFISAITDEPTGNLTYVELFNGTGSPIDMSNFKLKLTYFGGAGSSNTSFPLTGIINNNSFKLIKISSDANGFGVIPDLTCTTCGGVNTNDNIRLQTTSGTDVDIWGTSDGTDFTPGPLPGTSTPGYTYQRKNNVPVPSTTWTPNDWIVADVVTNPVNYASVLNKFTLLPSINYQYTVDNGTFQTDVTLSNIPPGSHTLIVKDITTGCSSSTTFTINNVPLTNNAVTTFNYQPNAVVCQNGTNPLPGNFGVGFITGGTFSEDTTLSNGLVFISTLTGEIDLVNSTTGIHTVIYTVVDQPSLCLAGGQSSATIEIQPIVTPVIAFTYTTPICKNAQPTLLSPSAPGLSSFATFSATPSGLVFTNTSTGVIDLANTTPGFYDIIVNVPADATTCRVSAATSPAFRLEIKSVITLETGFSYDTPFCANNGFESPNPYPGFAAGGTYSSTDGLIINPNTGAIDLTSTPGLYTVKYIANPIVGNCEVASPGTTQITIVPPVTIELTGGCQSVNYVLTASPVNGSFNPETATYTWENGQGLNVGSTQSIEVPATGVYTVTVNVLGCDTTSLPFNVDSISCVIQKGISVNNDGLNDTFDLSGYNVKKLTIFNRLGMKVYTRNDYVNEWGGKSDNGDELPDGTYYFIIDRNNSDTKTGWIYINRAQ